MQRPRVSETLAFAVPLLLSSCGSDHHVSPWGSAESPRLAVFAERGNLDAQTALIDAETATLKLRLTAELNVALPQGEGPALIRGYEGEDALRRRTHAVRVATRRGVVMALGPLDARELGREQATELVPALLPGEGGDARGGAYRSGTDVNGDGEPDVVVRSERGALEIWRLAALGANRYDVELEIAPTRAIGLEGDTRIALAGDVALDPDDPIAPRFTDVASFDGVRYSNQTLAARAFHAQRAPRTLPPSGDAPRLRSALEGAWHAVLSGDKSKEAARKDLDREPVPPGLRAAFDQHLRRIEAIKARADRHAAPDLTGG